MADRSIFTELEIPEICQTCPSIRAHLREWQANQEHGDLILDFDIEQSEEIIRSLPDSLILQIGDRHSVALNPALMEDRQRAFHLQNTHEYEKAAREVARREQAISYLVSLCEGRGTEQLELARKSGSQVVITVCSGVIEGACIGHAHEEPVDIHREPNDL